MIGSEKCYYPFQSLRRLHDPLLTNNPHELDLPLIDTPLSIADSHKLINVLAMSGELLVLPLALAKVHRGKIGHDRHLLPIGVEVDVLGGQTVLGCNGLQSAAKYQSDITRAFGYTGFYRLLIALAMASIPFRSPPGKG